MPLYSLTGNERVKDAMRLAYEFTRDKRAEIFGNGVTIRNVSCATKILETWWSMSGEKEAEEHVKVILHYWVSRQQTKGDLGNFVGINRTWGKGKNTSPEAFNPYNIKMDGPNEIPDPNDWTEKKTIGWRLSEFGTTDAMMDWYNLTGDEKVGQSVARFIRATKLYGSFNNWYKGQQMLAFAWRLTKDEAFRDWLRADMRFNQWGAIQTRTLPASSTSSLSKARWNLWASRKTPSTSCTNPSPSMPSSRTIRHSRLHFPPPRKRRPSRCAP
jgi:hypothetical protein